MITSKKIHPEQDKINEPNEEYKDEKNTNEEEMTIEEFENMFEFKHGKFYENERDYRKTIHAYRNSNNGKVQELKQLYEVNEKSSEQISSPKKSMGPSDRTTSVVLTGKVDKRKSTFNNLLVQVQLQEEEAKWKERANQRHMEKLQQSLNDERTLTLQKMSSSPEQITRKTTQSILEDSPRRTWNKNSSVSKSNQQFSIPIKSELPLSEPLKLSSSFSPRVQESTQKNHDEWIPSLEEIKKKEEEEIRLSQEVVKDKRDKELESKTIQHQEVDKNKEFQETKTLEMQTLELTPELQTLEPQTQEPQIQEPQIQTSEPQIQEPQIQTSETQIQEPQTQEPQTPEPQIQELQIPEPKTPQTSQPQTQKPQTQEPQTPETQTLEPKILNQVLSPRDDKYRSKEKKSPRKSNKEDHSKASRESKSKSNRKSDKIKNQTESVLSPRSAESDEKDKIKLLENKLKSLEKKIDYLESDLILSNNQGSISLPPFTIERKETSSNNLERSKSFQRDEKKIEKEKSLKIIVPPLKINFGNENKEIKNENKVMNDEMNDENDKVLSPIPRSVSEKIQITNNKKLPKLKKTEKKSGGRSLDSSLKHIIIKKPPLSEIHEDHESLFDSEISSDGDIWSPESRSTSSNSLNSQIPRTESWNGPNFNNTSSSKELNGSPYYISSHQHESMYLPGGGGEEPLFIKRTDSVVIRKKKLAPLGVGFHAILKPITCSAEEYLKQYNNSRQQLVISQELPTTTTPSISPSTSPSTSPQKEQQQEEDIKIKPTINFMRTFNTSTLRLSTEFRLKCRENHILKTAINLFNSKPKKAVEVLIQENLLVREAYSIAEFMIETYELDKSKIGEYLGEEDQFCQDVLDAYVSYMEFSDLDLDIALRRFLFCFRLPGEATKIDRIVKAFAKHYFLQNQNSFWDSPGSLHIMAFSILILNTDIHNPNNRNKMTKEQFIENTIINIKKHQKNLSNEYLIEIYEKIFEDEIKMKEDGALFPHSLKKGWCLLKRKGHTLAKKRFWCILADGCLYAMKRIQDSSPYLTIHLNKVTVMRCDFKGRKSIRFLDSTSSAFIINERRFSSFGKQSIISNGSINGEPDLNTGLSYKNLPFKRKLNRSPTFRSRAGSLNNPPTISTISTSPRAISPPSGRSESYDASDPLSSSINQQRSPRFSIKKKDEIFPSPSTTTTAITPPTSTPPSPPQSKKVLLPNQKKILDVIELCVQSDRELDSWSRLITKLGDYITPTTTSTTTTTSTSSNNVLVDSGSHSIDSSSSDVTDGTRSRSVSGGGGGIGGSVTKKIRRQSFIQVPPVVRQNSNSSNSSTSSSMRSSGHQEISSFHTIHTSNVSSLKNSASTPNY